MHELPNIRRRLTEHQAQTMQPDRKSRQAAVAIILRQANAETEVLFIRRADRAGDIYSGQMAFPGGHREAQDADLRAAAVRETDEEVGLDLSTGEYLGALDETWETPRQGRSSLLIAPHVFAQKGSPSLHTSPEVAEVVWAPLPALASNQLHAVENFVFKGTETPFNGYRLSSGHFVWGLTYRILKRFFTTLNPHWQAPKEILPPD